jgi:UMF1 family MFS transporter
VVLTAALGLRDNVWLNLIFFAVANFGCQAAVIFYNALLVEVSPRGKLGLVSGIGRAFAYSGAILALYLIKPIVVSSGYRAAFLPTAALFLVFSLPCLIFVRDSIAKEKAGFPTLLKSNNLRKKLGGLIQSARSTYALSGMSDFFKASFFAMAAVNTILLFMAVYATKVFGLGEGTIIHLIAFSTIFAILGSLLSGALSDYFGNIRALVAVFFLWIACFLFGALARSTWSYYFIGALVGVTLGATWAVSRSLVASLIPREKMGAAFGLFNLIGQLAAIVGALFWGTLLLFLSRFGEIGYRFTLFSLNIFMAFGMVFIVRLLKLKGKNNLCA